ncbi:MAG: nucleotidyltransferase domain-containing protein [Nanoarchaeota archaeon]|nr:nucleotidyltransferase domain-containing protein [Nanoarchaeota archaeon]
MLTKEQIRILGAFKQEPFIKLTFKQIKGGVGQKSNNLVQKSLSEFGKEGLITTEKVGNVILYGLNLENNLTFSYLNLINDLDIEAKKSLKEILQNLQDRLMKHTQFFILLVFGSYAKNKQGKGSDLDIAIIVESGETKKEITPLIETIKRRELTKIDYHVITKDEFLEMVKADYENLGKQIYKNNMVFYGFVNYLNLIKEIKHE